MEAYRTCRNNNTIQYKEISHNGDDDGGDVSDDDDDDYDDDDGDGSDDVDNDGRAISHDGDLKLGILFSACDGRLVTLMKTNKPLI